MDFRARQGALRRFARAYPRRSEQGATSRRAGCTAARALHRTASSSPCSALSDFKPESSCRASTAAPISAPTSSTRAPARRRGRRSSAASPASPSPAPLARSPCSMARPRPSCLGTSSLVAACSGEAFVNVNAPSCRRRVARGRVVLSLRADIRQRARNPSRPPTATRIASSRAATRSATTRARAISPSSHGKYRVSPILVHPRCPRASSRAGVPLGYDHGPGHAEASRLVASRDWLGALDAFRDVEPEEGNQFEIAYLFGICHAGSANGTTPCSISSRS